MASRFLNQRSYFWIFVTADISGWTQMNADGILSVFICVHLPSSAVTKIPTLTQTQISHSTNTARRNQLSIFSQNALSIARFRRLPKSQSLLQFCIRNIELQQAIVSINRNRIALFYQSNCASYLRFGCNVTDHHAVSSARE